MKRISIVAATCLTLVMSACGGGGTAEPDSEGMREVSVGMLPILPTAAMHVGIDQGFFEDHDIKLKIETGQGGAALLPAVMSQQLQFASSNPVSLLTARDKGLKVKVISHWTSEHETADEAINGVVAKEAGIKSAKDLAGKTVAINTLKSMGDLTIREAVRKDGGDPDKVKFVELPFPDMPAALGKSNIDAAWVPEPFMSGLVASGSHVVTPSSVASVPGMPTQLMFTSAALQKKDPQLVKDMTAALEETLEYAEEHPEAVRKAIPKVNPKVDAATASKVRIEAFGTDLRTDQVERLGELMKQEKWIKKDADVKGLLP